MNRPHRICLGALLALAALRLGAQEAPSSTAGSVRQAVEVRALDLDVVAMTKDGRPVEDLRREEISVRVDGRPFPVDYFARVSAGTVHGPDLATASPELILETTLGDEGTRYVPRQFLLFFDDAHLLPPERNRVIEALRDFVTRLTPSDRASLAAFGTTTRVLVPFTASKEDLLDGLDRLSKMAPAGLRHESEFRQQVFEIQRSRLASTRDSLVRTWAQQAYARDRATLEELRRAVAALAGRPGKRVLVLVSDGIELRPGQSLAQALGSHALMQFERDVAPGFAAVLAEANRAGVTIDTLDAKGLVAEGDASSSTPSPFNSFLVSENLRESLQGLADGTGGTLATNRNAFGPALDRIYRDSSSYYSVGVTLQNLDPKVKEHEVSVATTRPEVVLRTRRHAAVRTPDDAVRSRVEMALMNPAAAGDFPATVTLGPAQKGGGLGHRIVPFTVTVPVSALTATRQGDRTVAAVELWIAAVSDTGERSGISSNRITALLEAGAATWSYSVPLKSGKGNYRFVAGLRDLATDRTAIASASARVE